METKHWIALILVAVVFGLVFYFVGSGAGSSTGYAKGLSEGKAMVIPAGYESCKPYFPTAPVCEVCQVCPVVNDTVCETTEDSVLSLRDEALTYGMDEEFSDLKYCDGIRYKKSEMSSEFGDSILYNSDEDNKYIEFDVTFDYDNDRPSERCDADYHFAYHLEDGEEPELNITTL